MKRGLIFALVLVLVLSTTAYAADTVDLTRPCDLAISFLYDEAPVAGARFDLYRVGDLHENMDLTLSGEFADYPIRLEGLDEQLLQAAADALAGYVALNGHEPIATLTTDDTGHAAVTGLESGLYLLVGHSVETEEGHYLVDNQLVLLPYVDQAEDVWKYDLTVQPKAKFVPKCDVPMKLQVIKVWDHNRNPVKDRPTTVTVHLLKDGELFDTVTLSKDTSWRHIWRDLDSGREWTIVEDVPEHYTVTITKLGATYIITNRYDVPEPPVTPPPSTPPSTPPSVPPTTPPDIPQTGQTWWPVPVLFLLGTVLIIMGLCWRKGNRDA